MTPMDPLNPITAILEMVLLLALAALIGWLLGRWLFAGRVRSLRTAIASKKQELAGLRQGNTAAGIIAGSGASVVQPETSATFVPADPLQPALSHSDTPAMIDADEPPLTVIGEPPIGAPNSPASSVVRPVVPGETSETIVLDRIEARADELNFDRIGRATPTEADDLKDIVGVGPFLERKLHRLGIYTFRQVASFSKEDARQINEIIEFFPGRIEGDKWVEQARELHERKYGTGL
jgi:predicted flap endonuclease-1-like 5' DNA nuclease